MINLLLMVKKFFREKRLGVAIFLGCGVKWREKGFIMFEYGEKESCYFKKGDF